MTYECTNHATVIYNAHLLDTALCIGNFTELFKSIEEFEKQIEDAAGKAQII